MASLPIPTEHEEQVALIWWWAWACKRYGLAERLLFAIPNAGAGASKGQAGKMKAEGARPGTPDLMLAVPIPPYAGLFIEVKRVRGGKTSAAQAEAILALRFMGYRVELAAGFDEARAAIEDYLREAA